MIDANVIVLSILSGIVTCIVLFALLTFSKKPAPVARPTKTNPDPCAFQFSNGTLVDMSEDARSFLQVEGHDQTVRSFADLSKALNHRFPSFPAETPKQDIRLRAASAEETLVAEILVNGPYVRVVLEEREFGVADLERLTTSQNELQILRRAVSDAPDPIWRCNRTNGVTWANDAFRALQIRAGRNTEDTELFDLSRLIEGKAQSQRAMIELPNCDTPTWYEVTTRPAGDSWMCYATNIDAVVQAEMTQRNFVQTLAKTFAHLPTGLAIFDRNRFLALFNPAMIDLTGIPAEFLGSRPNVISFFDRIREAQVMPEPKNYQTWRERLAELVAAASDDRYCETWSLPSGLTYRVTGRPHPDGAIAFLFEDISAEVSLTRRFRAEMEISQSVLDSFDDAIAVFSQVGVLTMSNTAYRRMWASDPNNSFSELTVIDATRLWQKLCEPAGVWPELRDFVTVGQERATWDFQLEKRSGERLHCTVDPISAGSTLVRFSVLPRTGNVQPKDLSRTVA